MTYIVSGGALNSTHSLTPPDPLAAKQGLLLRGGKKGKGGEGREMGSRWGGNERGSP